MKGTNVSVECQSTRERIRGDVARRERRRTVELDACEEEIQSASSAQASERSRTSWHSRASLEVHLSQLGFERIWVTRVRGTPSACLLPPSTRTPSEALHHLPMRICIATTTSFVNGLRRDQVSSRRPLPPSPLPSSALPPTYLRLSPARSYMQVCPVEAHDRHWGLLPSHFARS